MPPLADREKDVPGLVAHARLQIDPVTNHPVLLYPEGILELDETAAALLQLCDGRRTLREIAAALGEEFEAPPDEILGDAVEFLDDLAGKGLLLFQGGAS